MEEDISKHLEFIQNVITRMAGNSFLLKGWSITIVAALFALAAKDSEWRFAFLALFPSLTFWGLDAYYLRQERLFRKLYDSVRLSTREQIKSIDPFSLNTDAFKKTVDSWFKTLWAPTIFALHGVIVFLILIVILYFYCLNRG